MENPINFNSTTSGEPQLAAEVLSAIEQEKVQMRPRWYFVVMGALAVAGVVIAAIGALYVFSLVVFVLQQDGSWAATSYGTRGLYVFLVSAPWQLIGLSLLFVALLEAAVRRYAFAYRRPLLVSVGVILLVVLAGAWGVAETPLHLGLMRQSETEHGLPIAGRWYRVFGEDRGLHYVHLGVVEDFTDVGFVLREFHDNRANVQFETTMMLPVLTIGDRVAVFGEEQDGVIEAFGVQKFVLMDDGRHWPAPRPPIIPR